MKETFIVTFNNVRSLTFVTVREFLEKQRDNSNPNRWESTFPVTAMYNGTDLYGDLTIKAAKRKHINEFMETVAIVRDCEKDRV